MLQHHHDDVAHRRLANLLGSIDITIINNLKGGVGKTTLATHLAVHLAEQEQNRVLFLDGDMQANGSQALLPRVDKPTLTDVIRDDATIDAALVEARPRLWVLPADMNLDKAGDYIISDPRKLVRLLHAWVLSGGMLDPQTGTRQLPTHILLDTAGMTTITKACLLCAKDMLVPITYEYFSFTGVMSLLEKIRTECLALVHQVLLRGIVPSQVDERRRITRQYFLDLWKDEELGAYLYPPVHRDVRIAEAQARVLTVFDYAPSSRGAQELRRVARIYAGEEPLDDYLTQVGQHQQEVQG